MEVGGEEEVGEGWEMQAGSRVMHGLGGQATTPPFLWTGAQKLRKIKGLD